jgi:hypothetical protein
MNSLPSGTRPGAVPIEPEIRGVAASNQLAWQLVTWDRGGVAASDDLEEAFSSTDPVETAKRLYVAILGRPPEPDSKAAKQLAEGLSAVTLARSLLHSHEGENQASARWTLLAHDLEKRTFREVWGLPLAGSLGQFVTDLDVHLVLAGYRVGLGRSPLPSEFAEGRRLLEKGLGRERFLRMIWREPGAKARLFGPVRRDLRGAVNLLRRPRLFSGFRAHVLSVESALSAAILTLHLDAAVRPTERSGDDASQQWQTLARINEISAGLRRLVGDQGW